jgi:hypothetical protein
VEDRRNRRRFRPSRSGVGHMRIRRRAKGVENRKLRRSQMGNAYE